MYQELAGKFLLFRRKFLLLHTTALIVPRISFIFPSFAVTRDLMCLLPNLHLADANLFDCRPVDLLLGADLYPRIFLLGTHTDILDSLIVQQTA